MAGMKRMPAGNAVKKGPSPIGSSMGGAPRPKPGPGSKAPIKGPKKPR